MLRNNSIVILLLLLLFQITLAEVKVEKFILPENGLKILLISQKGSPTVSCQLFFNTGSVHEKPGKTGIAHLLEHLLFKGTRKVGISDSTQDAIFIPLIDSLWEKLQNLDSIQQKKTFSQLQKQYSKTLNQYRSFFVHNELWNSYVQAGGTNLNAFTSNIITGYTVTLPKNKIELFFWLESDRMKNAVLREFYPERSVVMEERRMRYENSPYGRYFEKLKGIFYEAHPYRQPIIGYQADLENLSREQAYTHYKKYYKPNNATLVLIGDFETKPTLKKIKTYFSAIPKGPLPPKIITKDPKPLGESTLLVRTDNAKSRMDFWFKTPGFPNQKLYALEILSGILNGKSGHLYQHFVLHKKLALSTSSYNLWQPTHSMFSISFELAPSIDHQKIKKELKILLDSLIQNPILEKEMQKVKNQIRSYSLNQLKNPNHLSKELAFYEIMGDWNYINSIPKKINMVSEKKIKSALKEFIQLNNFTLGIVTGTQK